MSHVTVYCDGGSRGNPGPAAAGAVILRDKEVVAELQDYLGIATNNVAEYTAVVIALQKLHQLGIAEADFFLDSELVVRQLTGVYKVKNPDMKRLFEQVKNLSVGLKLSFTHVLREKNKHADRMVNECLDKHSTNR
jgi:ribonuclease HI